MKYWICMDCGLVHSEKTVKCKCGASILLILFVSHRWLYFASVEALEEWIGKMNKHIGAKLKYAGD